MNNPFVRSEADRFTVNNGYIVIEHGDMGTYFIQRDMSEYNTLKYKVIETWFGTDDFPFTFAIHEITLPSEYNLKSTKEQVDEVDRLVNDFISQPVWHTDMYRISDIEDFLASMGIDYNYGWEIQE